MHEAIMTANEFRNVMKLELSRLDASSWLEVQLTHCVWHIIPRPHYCDRGRYLWHCDSIDQRAFSVDGADCFPRYFFGIPAFIMEMQAWMAARHQQVVAIEAKKARAVPALPR
jgi:hypothetical protein